MKRAGQIGMPGGIGQVTQKKFDVRAIFVEAGLSMLVHGGRAVNPGDGCVWITGENCLRDRTIARA